MAEKRQRDLKVSLYFFGFAGEKEKGAVSRVRNPRRQCDGQKMPFRSSATCWASGIKPIRRVIRGRFKRWPPDYKKSLARIAVGEYRVVYRYTEDIVALVVCGKRNDDEVYAMLKWVQ